MNGVIQNLKDPSWWFTALFMGILASVLAGFLKDHIERWLSSLSVNFRSARAKKAGEREQLIESLASDAQFLTLAYLEAIEGLLLFVTITLLFFALPGFIEFMPLSPITGFPIPRILVPVTGIMSIFAAFFAASRIALVRQAYRLYRTKKGFPKLP